MPLRNLKCLGPYLVPPSSLLKQLIVRPEASAPGAVPPLHCPVHRGHVPGAPFLGHLRESTVLTHSTCHSLFTELPDSLPGIKKDRLQRLSALHKPPRLPTVLGMKCQHLASLVRLPAAELHALSLLSLCPPPASGGVPEENAKADSCAVTLPKAAFTCLLSTLLLPSGPLGQFF